MSTYNWMTTWMTSSVIRKIPLNPIVKRDYETGWTNVIINPSCAITLRNWSAKICQKYKLAGCGYGLLLKRKVQIAPWEEVAIDLIGPWKVKVNGWQVEFNALTCIDMASNLVKLI